MNIAMINPPFKVPSPEGNVWIKVPPQGYGGIQWVVKNLADGLLELGHHLYLLGAPGSESWHPCLRVVDAGEIPDIEEWLRQEGASVDVIHDHTCRGPEFGAGIKWGDCAMQVHSHYLCSPPAEKRMVVAQSNAHALAIGFPDAPVIRAPVNVDSYEYRERKDDYLLYMGRVSRWKGADIAALFAEKAGLPLFMCGPSWETDYFDELMSRFPRTIRYLGECGGGLRRSLFANAKATLVFSADREGPLGIPWVEPGSTVVSESAASGTPVISSTNGCLREIVPHVGVAVDDPWGLSNDDARGIVSKLPRPAAVRQTASDLWGHVRIAKEYEGLYMKVISGLEW